MKSIKVYKITDNNMRCRDYQFELGKRHEYHGKISICNRGFHSCIKPQNCLNYYNNGINRMFLCEIEIMGNEQFEGGNNLESSEKICSSNITFLEEVTHNIQNLVNSGNWNSGNRNSGNRNSGNRNSGDWNSGNMNSGNMNSGNMNSGDWNSGDWNSGDWNSGNGKNRYFCTQQTPNYFFNQISNKKESDLYFPSWLYFDLIKWIDESIMNDKEKEQYPYYKTCGGYLKEYSYQQAAQESYNKATKEEQRSIEDIPNYSHELLFKLFGIDRTNL